MSAVHAHRMGTSHGFDPNQKRDQTGKWETHRGTRPAAGSLSPAPAKQEAVAEPEDEFTAPAHWNRYTPEQQQRLRDLVPYTWDEMGSSEKDMWEERTLAAFARIQERAERNRS